MAGAILGDPVQITARADFAIRGGIIAGVPIGPTPPPNPDTCTKALVPNLVGKTVADARATWSNAGFTGSFSPNSSADDTDIVTSQTTNPVAYPGDCVDATTSVSVQHEPEADCPSGEEHVPNVIGDTLATARSKWTAAGFTGSFLPSTGYDSDLVTTQATSTGKGPGECSVLSTLITVGHSSPQTFCTAPDLSGLTANAAQTSFQAAGFAGTFKSQGPSTGTVSGQSLVAGQPYLCSSGITVTLKK
jgi:beta-lactam-binding protein with PASTA domain